MKLRTRKEPKKAPTKKATTIKAGGRPPGFRTPNAGDNPHETVFLGGPKAIKKPAYDRPAFEEREDEQ